MAADVGLFVKDADDIQIAVIGFDIENEVVTASYATIVPHQPVDALTKAGIFRDGDEGIEKLRYITLALIERPMIDGVIPDVLKIDLSGRLRR